MLIITDQMYVPYLHETNNYHVQHSGILYGSPTAYIVVIRVMYVYLNAVKKRHQKRENNRAGIGDKKENIYVMHY